MLAHVNRITSGSDYQGVVRRGVRIVGPHTVLYVRKSEARTNADLTVDTVGAPVRFGFIVAKNVGDAVRRNLVRRRLKAVTFELLSLVPPGTDVIVRALPAARDAAWQTLRDEVQRSLSRPHLVRKGSAGR
ncbi:MAG: ribonuclease P protein component [Cryobacterium sp.]|uniref:ribonuclease P protein component n=1 Tax=unclassified Cryobacterium TaxID=2649013 RepID=UPI0018CB9B5D|nr:MULTISPECIES: ribonuclease P protein component [unclassified Cryobacterium]MCY7404040.1 ribonuclease P protein component [Cryobacterium sp.]